MRWTSTYTDTYEWHTWFAWHPVRIAHVRRSRTTLAEHWVWLAKIERKAVGNYGGSYWDYREKK